MNYFEILELENSYPSPTVVKKKYKEKMNKFAEESGVQNTPKGKKKNKKKDYKNMTEEEIKIDKEKTKLKQIYDCLMFS